MASESVAIDVLDLQLQRDVGPGEAIFISNRGELFTRSLLPAPTFAPCLFEYVYFARPDSVSDWMCAAEYLHMSYLFANALSDYCKIYSINLNATSFCR